MKTTKNLKLLFVLMIFVMIPCLAPATAPKAGENIGWQVVSSGGNSSNDGAHNISATIGQTAAGEVSSASNRLNQGFWQLFTVMATFICGDANHNGAVNILDVSYIINSLYKGGPPPNPAQAADVNGNGAVNILDVSYLINFLYKSGPALNCP